MKKSLCFSLVLLLMFTVSCKKSSEEIHYGSHERQTLDIEVPKGYTQPVPVIFCIHGGSWSKGDKGDFAYMKDDILKEGCAYVSINYRLIEDEANCSDMLSDIALAMTWLKTHATEYNINTQKIGMIGSSAGGHLALLYGYGKQTPLAASIIVSKAGPIDFIDKYQWKTGSNRLELINKLCNTHITSQQMNNYLAGTSPTISSEDMMKLKIYSPLYNVHNNTPFTLIAHGQYDNLVAVETAAHLHDTLTQLNRPHQYFLFPNSGHDLSADPEISTAFNKAMQEAVRQYLSNE